MKQQNFITEYCRILDQCHGQREDELWFSTWMASKSPYFEFPKRMEHFWKIGEIQPQLTIAQKCFKVLRLTLTLFFLIVKSFYLKLIFHKELDEIRRLSVDRKFNLLRTFCYSWKNSASDTFWGDLLPALVGNPENPLLVIYDPGFSVIYSRKAYQPEFRNFPYFIFLDLKSILKSYLRLIKQGFSSHTWKGDLNIKGKEITKIIENTFQFELLAPSALTVLAFKNALENLFKLIEVNRIYIPFENNPWEKMCYFAREKSKQNMEIVGYQHATVQEGATNYRLSQYEASRGYYPDIIFTVGLYTKKLLKSYSAYEGIDVRSGCALRYKYLDNLKQESKDISLPLHLLVTLDGTPDTKILLEFLDQFLNLKPENVRIKIKEHPNQRIKLFWPEFLHKHYITSGLVEITNDAVAMCLKWSDAVLYTGTTVSVEALKLGRAVINYNFSLFNYDPLFQFRSFKWEVKEPGDLIQVLREFSELSPSDLKFKREEGVKFVDEYFTPCNQQKIQDFMSIRKT